MVLSVHENVKVFAGPSLAYFLNGELESKVTGNGVNQGGTLDLKGGKNGDFKFDVVLGGSFHFQQFILDIRYSQDSDFWSSQTNDTNHVFQFLAGMEL